MLKIIFWIIYIQDAKKNPNKFGVIGSYLANCKNFLEKSFRKKRNLKLACYDCILNIDMNGPKNSL